MPLLNYITALANVLRLSEAVDAAEALLVDAAFIDDVDTQKRLAGYL